MGPGDETGGTANLTTAARFRSPLLASRGSRVDHDAHSQFGLRGGEARVASRELRRYATVIDSSKTMTVKRAAAYSGAGLLLLAWLASAAGLARQTSEPEHVSEPGGTGTPPLAAEVEAQTLRLKTRLAAAPAPQEPLRNPFTFAPRASTGRRSAPTREAVVEPAPIGPPAEPAIELIGVAENETPDGVRRTAIISALGGELFLVKEGETVAARYRVGAVSGDAVELQDLLLGTVRRLALRE